MNVVVVTISLYDCVLEVEDGDMKIDYRTLVRHVRVSERITLLLQNTFTIFLLKHT